MTDITGILNSIYYMTELLCACGLFFIHGQKRSAFLKRTVLGTALMELLAVSWFLLFPGPSDAYLMFLSSAIYILSCIPFIHFCLNCSWTQAAFCTACAFAIQHISFGFSHCYEIMTGIRPGWEILICIVSYGVCYFFFVRHLNSGGEYGPQKSDLAPMATIFLFAWGLSIIERNAAPSGEAALFRVLFQLSDILCCFYILWTQTSQQKNLRLKRELDGMEQMIRQQKKQYEVTQETIATINRKCHDLRHQLRVLENTGDPSRQSKYFKELEQAIRIYDTSIHTGNPGLDVILMEKGLYCQSSGIEWTCMVDGARLDFMEPEDIYAMFGNALDNAITAVLELDEPDKRVISTKMITQNQLIVIQIQNYYAGERKMVDGIPLTTKENPQDHGFGVKSIFYTAEKYNGTVSVQAEGNIFTLQILLPVPEEKS